MAEEKEGWMLYSGLRLGEKYEEEEEEANWV